MSNSFLSRLICTLCLLVAGMLLTVFSIAQQGPVLPNHKRGDMQIAIVPLGMDKPIPVGRLHSDGRLEFKWPKKLDMSDDERALFDMPLWQACGIPCTPTDDNRQAIPVGGIFLYQDGEQHGALYAATSPLLGNWLETPQYNAADTGRIACWVYSNTTMEDTVNCGNPVGYEGKTFETTITGSLRFQPGFNIVMVKVEKVHNTDPDIRAPFATRVDFSSVPHLPESFPWQVRWFFD